LATSAINYLSECKGAKAIEEWSMFQSLFPEEAKMINNTPKRKIIKKVMSRDIRDVTNQSTEKSNP